MKRVAVLDDYQGVAMDMTDWSPLDGRAEVTVFRDHIDSEDELRRRLRDFEVVVCMRERTAMPASVIEGLDKLELLVTTGPFNAVVDFDAARSRGVVCSGTGGWLHNTAELTWGLVLACARNIPAEDSNVKNGGWMTTVGTDLFGSTLGLLGLGRLGGLVATVGNAFGMNVVAWSQNLTAERCAEVGATLVGKEELLRTADIVSIHLVLSARTRGLVGQQELGWMKPSAILVNTSRGPICDEAALARALESRQIRAAGLDAFEVEPLPAGHPFRRLDNVVTTPHLGYVTTACYRIFFTHIVEDIVGFLDGTPVRVISGG